MKTLSDALIADLLLELGFIVRDRILNDPISSEQASRIVGVFGGDTVFGLDRHVEEVMLERIRAWPKAALPVAIFAEGLASAPIVIGPAKRRIQYWLLIDPIDGTRGLMYGKRSAYFLATAAPGDVGEPKLSNSTASVAVELPTPKQRFCDSYIWISGEKPWAKRTDLADGTTSPMALIQPTKADAVDNGFGSVVAFFAEGRQHAAALSERIAMATGVAGASAQIFDDQYMSSGGQMIELLTGKDRFVIDLRPIVSEPLGGQSARPYDLAAAPLALAAGVRILAPDGGAFDAPFDLESSVCWCGYANDDIKNKIHPIVNKWITENFM